MNAVNGTITGPADRRIVAGVDGSEAALHAVEWAVHEAGLRGIGLHLVHAAPYLQGAADSPERRRARAILAGGYTVAHHAAPDLPVTTELAACVPVEVLVYASKGTALLVLGMVGAGVTDEILLGSVALDVSARAHSPVVVVRGRRRPDPDNGRVLLGVGAESCDDPAIGFAFDAAQRRGVELLVVHGLHGTTGWLAGDRNTVSEVEHALISVRLADWRRRHPSVRVRPVVLRGRPTELLLAQAQGAQLVVVGTRSRSSAARPLLGSTSRGLLRHSPCPVAVVRPDVVPAPAMTASPSAERTEK
jgi:nucleotide-binding universal stress UspA family protein